MGAALFTAAQAAPPPPPPPPAQGAPPPADASQGVPDDGLIEFLGTDDVGDAAWWEFLKKGPPRVNPPAPPPQEVRQ